ncbi:MAG TPA: hypothetical protein VFS40_11620 [Gemmatimonadales bacterium]|nr:hypothetical protein [Gemmatimonadales bacterium]
MNRYWLRIALGAIGIFVLGMVVVTGFRRGKSEVSKRLSGIAFAQALVPAKLGALTLDGARLGTVDRIHIARDSAGGQRQMTVTVAPADSADLARLEACPALAGDLDQLFQDEGEGLRCTAADTAGLARFGTLTAAGTDLARPLYAPADQVAKFDRDDDHDGAQVIDIRADSGSGRANITVQNADGRKLVQIQADSQHGAWIDVRDNNGKPVFQLRADSTGVEMKAGGKRTSVRR